MWIVVAVVALGLVLGAARSCATTHGHVLELVPITPETIRKCGELEGLSGVDGRRVSWWACAQRLHRR